MNRLDQFICGALIVVSILGVVEFVHAAIQFQGYKQFYMVDTESDINSSWPPGTSIYAIGSNTNYQMQASGVYTSSLTRTISSMTVTLSGTGATGAQISPTKNATVHISGSTSITSTIGGPSTSLIILKICATNSATESDWIESGRVETDQTITLAVVLQSTNLGAAQMSAELPVGWYFKVVNSGTGTHAENILSAQKTIYG